MMKQFALVLTGWIMTTGGLAQEAAPCPGTVMVADGNVDEWAMEWQQADDKAFSYNICSDDNNLYIRMKTSIETVRRKIAVFGLTIWMDPNGKKKKKLGLRFPTGQEGKERMMVLNETYKDQSRMSTSEKADLRKQLNKSLIVDVDMMELIGLSDEPLTSSRSGITNGIKVAITAMEEGDYVYEAIIPFKSFRLSKAAIEDLGIGFETGKYIVESKNQPNQGPPQQGGMGAGGRGYGGYGGGGGRSHSNWQGYQGSKNSDMMSSSSAWTTLKLK